MTPGDPPTNPILELSALQERRGGHLTDDDLRDLARRLSIPLYALEGLVSFYPHFRREPPPRRLVQGCRDLSCHLRGAPESNRRRAQACAAEEGARFEEISCPGLCDRAPAGLVDHEPEGAGPGTRAPRVSSEWRIDPYAHPDERYGVLRELVRSGDIDGALERITASGLRGMGGAGFPTGRKWATVRAQAAAPKYVVCNADESEPGAFKDRVVMEELPHLVVEGVAIACRAVGAEEAWVYLRHEYAAARRSLQAEIDAAAAAGVLGDLRLRLFVSPGGYILGEETAMLEALEGRRGEPRNKPPFPGVEGLYGKPTLINNVETLAQVPYVLREGRADLKLFSVSGDVERPGVVEAPLGTPFSELLAQVGGVREGRALLAFLPGGASTGFLSARHADVPMSWDGLAEAGSALGAGAVVVVAEGADLVELGGNLAAFFRNESCGKCVPCRIGTEKAVELIAAGDPDSLAQLPGLHEALLQTSLCGLGQVALTPILSVLEGFEESS